LLAFLSVAVFIACDLNSDPITYHDPIYYPTVSTGEINHVTQHTARCGGVLTSVGKSDAIVYGVCWSTSVHPTRADNSIDVNLLKLVDFTGTVEYSTPIDCLAGSATYYVRAYAINVKKQTNSDGYYQVGEIVYGNEDEFSTDVETPTVTDADGNVYQTIQIGTQLWMLENLRTTKYNDGTDIPTVKGDLGENIDLLSPYFYYYWYNPSSIWYNPLNYNTIGVLYNGYAVATRKLAPIGWHVPSINDWKKLSNYLGGDSISGGKLKSAKTTSSIHLSFLHLGNWMMPNTGATNSSGFSALPGGYYDNNNDKIYYDGTDPNSYGFKGNGYAGNWWSSTENMPNSLYSIALSYLNEGIYFTDTESTHKKRLGFSVRCVKD